ncbi:arylamine N-acetyltransferase family protein [Janthinobacterium agaricidamnosum]|uniref:Arylamine N-acetyltransferase n=1 Tax=Janthinobacterium agaricidamnosum NBRC 102515 = DSM 9628 TaxID=1349767 RepID=W0V6H3_9BURK|nr:arylamine N-acetyltransferase [Janthinobacterium agaricidamnosum]CDG83215.1 arylamine N-acetyltransferase [Janthinobacterium agaricidamnosum NBRC 102515 = DSM 9628]
MTKLQASNFSLYLQRLGYDRPPAPTLETLRHLQPRHTVAFPFETLSTMLHDEVPIDLPSLEHKILHAGRGGYCYELNNLFLALLLQLGFDARGITGSVVMGGSEDEHKARTHMLILVTLNGVRYIVDVGFGGMVPTSPLLLDTEDEQPTGHEPYRLTLHDGSYTLRAQVAGDWRALYVFDLQTQGPIDYEVGNWYVSTHQNSPFLGQLVVARTGAGLRRTLNNGSYAIHRIGAKSERWQFTEVDVVIDLLQNEFGIRMPQHPQLRNILERVITLSF